MLFNHLIHTFMRQLLIILFSFFLVTACSDSDQSLQNNEQITSLLKENDSLASQIKRKNSELDAITINMNQIETNLALIRRNEYTIDSLRKVGGVKQEEKINRLIKEIDKYVEDNRTKVDVLERQMRNTRNASVGLTRLVEQQKRTVFEKEQQIGSLMGTITNLREELLYTINTKNAEISDKQRLLEEKEALMNTVYFTFGSRDQLVERGIIRKEGGGLLGAGKAFKLASKFDHKSFQQANMREVNQIDVGIVDKRNVVTTHPAESYYFIKASGRTIIKIVDFQKFWSISKFLVIETEGGL